MFTDIITLSQITPGPLALNTSTFVGLQISGIPGAIVATLGCVIPGVTVALLLYLFFRRNGHSPYMSGVLEELKAASVGLIMSAGGTILMLTFCDTFDWHAMEKADVPSILLFGASLYILRKWRMNPMLLMLPGIGSDSTHGHCREPLQVRHKNGGAAVHGILFQLLQLGEYVFHAFPDGGSHFDGYAQPGG